MTILLLLGLGSADIHETLSTYDACRSTIEELKGHVGGVIGNKPLGICIEKGTGRVTVEWLS